MLGYGWVIYLFMHEFSDSMACWDMAGFIYLFIQEFSHSKACWDMAGLSTCLYRSLAIVRCAGIWLGYLPVYAGV